MTFEPILFRKFKFLLVNIYEYKLAKRPANIPAIIITITFIALFPVTVGIFNDGSYSKISTVKKYEIIDDNKMGEKLAKD